MPGSMREPPGTAWLAGRENRHLSIVSADAAEAVRARARANLTYWTRQADSQAK
jgi:hypothetical protein